MQVRRRPALVVLTLALVALVALLPAQALGAPLSVQALTSKLRVYGRAFYFTQGPIYDGAIIIETAAEVQMDPGTQDVWLDFDSDR